MDSDSIEIIYKVLQLTEYIEKLQKIIQKQLFAEKSLWICKASSGLIRIDIDAGKN